MPYGTIKVDNITFDNGGTDKLLTVSGLFFSTSGALTVTGTISGANVTAPTATFTTLTGTTTAGTTATFTSGSFTSLTGVTTTVTSGVFGLGSAAAPSISISGDPNTGIYSPGADQVAISTSGTGRLFVDASGNIKVSTGEIFQTSATSYIRLDGGTGSGTGANLIVFGESHGSAPGRISLSAVGTGAIIASAGGSERLRITSAGLVGVGTSSPASLFHIAGGGSGRNGALRFSDSGGANYWEIGRDNAVNGSFTITQNGTERLCIDYLAGNVGIGTTSPGNLLHLSTAGASYLQIQNTTAANSIYFGNSSGNGIIQVDGANSLNINTNGSERCRVDSSGRLLVGTSSARTNVYYTTVATTPSVQFESAGSTYNGLSLINYSASGYSPVLTLGLSASNTPGTNTAIASTHDLGAINFAGNDGTNFRTGASIIATNDQASAWAVGDCPGRLVFSTTADGAASPTERMRITSAGNVGIGTTSPESLLHLNGDVTAFRITRGSAIGFLYNTGTATTDPFRIQSNGGPVDIYTLASQPITFTIGTTERARIDSSGRLLVGTSSAVNTINYAGLDFTPRSQVVGAAYDEGALAVVRTQTSPFFFFCSGASGTNVVSGSGLGSLVFTGYHTTKYYTGAVITAEVDGTPGANDMPGRLVFSTTADGAASPTEAMRINNAGQILIGTTNNTGLATGSSVNQGIQISAGIAISQRNDNANNYWSKAAGYTSGDYTAHFVNNTYVGGISTNGSTTTYAVASDYRLKENVIAITDGIARCLQLKPSCFNFIGHSGNTVDGFLAHEVQQIVPEAVVGEKDATNEDGTIKPQGIDQSKLVPLLTAALQEAIARIETLEADVAALKGA